MASATNDTLGAAVHDAALILAEKLRPQILELENAGKNLKAEIARVKAEHARDVEYYLNEIDGLKQHANLLQERVAEIIPRPPLHQHDPDEPRPVITLDFDGTIKPQIQQGDGGTFPLMKNADPFPKVKNWLDRWYSRGACIHVATAALYYAGPQDLEIYNARLNMLTGWKSEFGMPISLFLPKVPSDLYYDDRMVVVPGDPTLKPAIKFVPDWDVVGTLVEADLKKRFDIVDGLWTRKEKKRVGTEYDEFPDIKDYPIDHPRGYSGPRLDVDMHRTLSLSSSSLRYAPPRPNAREVITEYYNRGITIRISCAGWNPKTHSFEDAQRRLAGIRQWLLENSIPYDRIVTKDHADAYIDDKGFRWTDWLADKPGILKRLPITEAYKHGD
jgi:hypothetical protein